AAAQPATSELKPALLANLARRRARLGDPERARTLLGEAEGLVPGVLDLDRAANFANIAASYLALGDDVAMWRLYALAFDAAETLANARPRVLAVVEICRSLGRNRVELNPRTRERLDALLAGLHEPW
ncbi:MAG TPA: hypothetical protein VJS92_02610, partial [Candidatus Polarisedimenticolaceae bacterium]|nr:hypothetical protein [Candidatus Polarisedimenticolaceae bacterium]